MASSLQQVVASIQQNNYVSLAVITVIVYDYILTFSMEIEHIWNKRWTWISTLFLLVRYFGLGHGISSMLLGTSFFPGPVETYVFIPHFVQLIQETDHTDIDAKQSLFMGNGTTGFSWARQSVRRHLDFKVSSLIDAVVMVIRVWVLCNRSKLVLSTLLVLYAMEQISVFAFNAFLQAHPGFNSAMSTAQVLQFSFCTFTETYMPEWLQILPAICQITLGAWLCLLTGTRLFQELLELYKSTKRITLNHYIECLVTEGMIYFVIVLMGSIFVLLVGIGSYSGSESLFILESIERSIFPITLIPRFILNLREIYAIDLRGRRGSNIDTAFGLGSGFDQDTIRSMPIAFAARMASEQDNDDQDDETEMEIQEVDRKRGVA